MFIEFDDLKNTSDLACPSYWRNYLNEDQKD